jgi:hypothetical protein
VPPDAYEKTDEENMKVKPKGCGCSTPGSRVPGGDAWALIAGALLLARALLRGRRRGQA